MKFETLEVAGLMPALHGMRNPKKSWDKSDSVDCSACTTSLGSPCPYSEKFYQCKDRNGIIGKNDLDLATRLVKGGSEHRKFLRYIMVWVDIIAPQYFLAEWDTYKVATNRNSTSLQHTGAKRLFTLEDFELDSDDESKVEALMIMIRPYLDLINRYRELYNVTQDYDYFRLMRQMLPMSYKYQITFNCSYETVLTMYEQRHNHKLKEWSGKDNTNTDGTYSSFVTWAESLPYFKEMCLEPLGLI